MLSYKKIKGKGMQLISIVILPIRRVAHAKKLLEKRFRSLRHTIAKHAVFSH